MDTCYKRYKELNVGEHKDNTFEVLSLSISNHYNIIVENAKVILAYIDSENNDSALMSVFKDWEQKLNYNPNVISLKNAIVKSLYKYEKYYLDK